MESTPDRYGFLHGLRILDLADEKASFCTRLLADMGACVIKVEKPGGSASRNTGPFLKDASRPKTGIPFIYNNTNKLDITLDLEHKEGRSIFLKLVPGTDAVVETFAPGDLKRMGLGFEALKALNPKLILASVTGFGQKGPRKSFKANDLIASAYGGQMYACGSPDRPPLKSFGDQSYYTASLFAATAILLALRNRAKSGAGEHLDISLQASVTATLEHVMVRYFSEGINFQRQGSRHWNEGFVILPCKDGFIHATLFQKWETLVEWLASEGMAEDLADEKWLDEDFRRQNLEHVIAVLKKWTTNHTVDEIFKLAQLMRFPWAPVRSPNEVINCSQLKARNFFIERKESGSGKPVTFPGTPYKTSAKIDIRTNPAPQPGEHNEMIYRQELGLSKKNLKRLYKTASSEQGLAQSEILKGLRVVDLTRIVAGPYTTRLLADFGAEVIKVQTAKMATGIESNTAPYFCAWNRNKRSITLDMDYHEAREIFLNLVEISDIVVENFSPRVMPNWGLDYSTLKKSNESIIMLSMSAAGQTGPWKDFVTYGPTVQSLGGLNYLTSYSKDAPIGLGYAYADIVSGLYGAFSILAALEHRDRCGQGQHIDLSEYEAVCTTIGPALMDACMNHNQIVPRGNDDEHAPAAPYGCYKCRGEDRWCVIAVSTEDQWQSLREVLGNPVWAEDERFSSLAARKKHKEILDKNIDKWTSGQMAEKVADRLQQAGIAAGVVQNAEDLANDPQLTAREFFTSLNHPVLGEIKTDAYPLIFKNYRQTPWKASTILGEANQYVFEELLGMTKTTIQSYIDQGIIV